MLLKITLKCLSLRVIHDLQNQILNVDAMWSFHHRGRHLRCWKSMFSSSIARLNLLFALDDAVSRCPGESNSCTVCVYLIPQVSPFYLEHSWRDCLHTSQVSPFYLKNQVLLATVYQQSLVNGTCFLSPQKLLSSPHVSPFDHRLDRVWIGRFSTKCFSKRLLNELSNWLLFNDRTRLIIPLSPIVIVFQWDLWWWSRRQISSFIQHLSGFQSFNFFKYSGLEVFLEEQLHSIVFDRMLILLWSQYRPKIPRLDAFSMHCVKHRARRGTE